jgi:hypothetical protein
MRREKMNSLIAQKMKSDSLANKSIRGRLARLLEAMSSPRKKCFLQPIEKMWNARQGARRDTIIDRVCAKREDVAA